MRTRKEPRKGQLIDGKGQMRPSLKRQRRRQPDTYDAPQLRALLVREERAEFMYEQTRGPNVMELALGAEVLRKSREKAIRDKTVILRKSWKNAK